MIDKKAFFSLSYGIYVISSALDGKFNGQIANSVFQITSEPQIIAVSINKQNLTHKFIDESSLFSISVLTTRTPMEFIGLFGFKSGKDISKFDTVLYKTGETRIPIVLDNSCASFEVKVESKIDVYTHTIFVGRVISSEVHNNEEPMTYSYYHKVKNGTAPKTAPTYLSDVETTKETIKSDKYKCTICGYIYNPAVGDPDACIPAGTAFKDLPESWVCPICSAGREKFINQD